MNKTAKEILTILEQNNHKAYIVGGYVRDFLLGINSTDIDICTNATMKEVVALFNGEVNEYNSLNLKRKELNIDITTFRIDGTYENRRPTSISYTSLLEKDIERRDFTINTICMNKDETIIDLLNGKKDLKNKIIRVVGNVKTKLIEDPLRILRAIRFATILDFELETELANEIKIQGHLVASLSTYRIKEELSKILTSPNFKKGLQLLKQFELCKNIGISYTNIVYTKDLCGMWAQMKFTIDLPFTKAEKENIVKLREIMDLKIINSEVIYKYGLYLSLIAGEILGIEAESIHEIYANMPIYQRKELSITFQEIIEILEIKPSKKAGEIEEELIQEVINRRIPNEIEKLKDYLLENKTRWLN